MLAALSLLGLTALGTNQALAWDGQEGWNGCGDSCGFLHWGYFHHWNFGGGCCDNQDSCCGIPQNGPCCGDNVQTNSCCDQETDAGFSDGVSDAVYDHQNNLAYNPIGSCIPCHSEDYWNNFRSGYDDKWNSFQSQDSNQMTKININGNNNYVTTNQESNQQQSPLQQLTHTVCGIINCNQLGNNLNP
jgi:hypothetical protein